MASNAADNALQADDISSHDADGADFICAGTVQESCDKSSPQGVPNANHADSGDEQLIDIRDLEQNDALQNSDEDANTSMSRNLQEVGNVGIGDKTDTDNDMGSYTEDDYEVSLTATGRTSSRSDVFSLPPHAAALEHNLNNIAEEMEDHQGEGLSEGEGDGEENDGVSQSENAEADQYLMESGESEQLDNQENNEERYEPEGHYGLGREFPGAGGQGGAELYGQIHPRPHTNVIHQWMMNVDPNPQPEDDQDIEEMAPSQAALIQDLARAVRLPLPDLSNDASRGDLPSDLRGSGENFVPGAENTYSYAPKAILTVNKENSPGPEASSNVENSPLQPKKQSPGERLPTQGMSSPDLAQILSDVNQADAAEAQLSKTNNNDNNLKDTQDDVPVNKTVEQNNSQHVEGAKKRGAHFRSHLHTEQRAAERKARSNSGKENKNTRTVKANYKSTTSHVAEPENKTRASAFLSNTQSTSACQKAPSTTDLVRNPVGSFSEEVLTDPLIRNSEQARTSDNLGEGSADETRPPPYPFTASVGFPPSTALPVYSSMSASLGGTTTTTSSLTTSSNLESRTSQNTYEVLMPITSPRMQQDQVDQEVAALLKQSTGLRALQSLLQSFNSTASKDLENHMPKQGAEGVTNQVLPNQTAASALLDDPHMKGYESDASATASLPSLSQSFEKMLGYSAHAAEGSNVDALSPAHYQFIKESLDREMYRRKLCEQKVQELQKKVLELNQQVAVAMETEVRKDKMIEHLDTALASVVENWRREEGDRQRRVKFLTQENAQLQQQQQVHQQSLMKFEEEMRKTIEKLSEEKRQAEEAEKTRESLLSERQKQLEEKQHELEEQKRSSHEEAEELRRKLTDLHQQAQQLKNQHNQDLESWQEKELVLTDRVKKTSEALGIIQKKLEDELELNRDYQTRLTVLQEDKKDLEKEVEDLFRQHDSLKVEYGVLENKMVEGIERTEQETRESMQIKMKAELEEQQRCFMQEERDLRAEHQEKITQLLQDHQRAMEQQLETFQLDRDRREQRFEERELETNNMIMRLKSELAEKKAAQELHEREQSDVKQRLQALMQSHFSQALQLIQNGVPSSPLPGYLMTEKLKFLQSPAVNERDVPASVSTRQDSSSVGSHSARQHCTPPASPPVQHNSSLSSSALVRNMGSPSKGSAFLSHTVSEERQSRKNSRLNTGNVHSSSHSTLVVSPLAHHQSLPDHVTVTFQQPSFDSSASVGSPQPPVLTQVSSQPHNASQQSLGAFQQSPRESQHSPEVSQQFPVAQQPPRASHQPPGTPLPLPTFPSLQPFTLKPVQYSEVESDVFSSVNTTPQSKGRDPGAAHRDYSPPMLGDNSASHVTNLFKDFSVQNYQSIEKIWKSVQEEQQLTSQTFQPGPDPSLRQQQVFPQQPSTSRSPVPADVSLKQPDALIHNSHPPEARRREDHMPQAALVKELGRELMGGQGQWSSGAGVGGNITFHPPVTIDTSGSGNPNSSGSTDEKMAHASRPSAGNVSSFSEKFEQHESRQAELQRYIRMLLDRPPGQPTAEKETASPNTSLPAAGANLTSPDAVVLRAMAHYQATTVSADNKMPNRSESHHQAGGKKGKTAETTPPRNSTHVTMLNQVSSSPTKAVHPKVRRNLEESYKSISAGKASVNEKGKGSQPKSMNVRNKQEKTVKSGNKKTSSWK